MEKDYYSILGVERTASEDDIKKAYRSLSKRYHPDLQQGKSDEEKKASEEKFKEINEAYSVLGDKEKRQQYDTFGSAETRGGFGPGGIDPMEFFRQAHASHFGSFGDFGDFGFGFGGGMHRNRPDPNAPKDGRDIAFDMEVSFNEAVFGATREFDVTIEEKCSHCHGTGGDDAETITCPECGGTGMATRRFSGGFGSNGILQTACPKCGATGQIPKTTCHVCNGNKTEQVKHHIKITIPRGISTNEHLRVPGEGEHGVNGGNNGDLYIIVHVAESELFKRNGDNLYTDAYIPAVGVGILDKIEVATPYGTKKIRLPKTFGADGKHVAHLAGCGIRRETPNGEVKGDLYITISTEPIANLTDEQKKLCKQLLDSLTESNKTKPRMDHEKLVQEFEASKPT